FPDSPMNPYPAPGGGWSPALGDKGSCLVYLLPYMEEEKLWKLIPNLNVPGLNSITSYILPAQPTNPNNDALGDPKGRGWIQILGNVPENQWGVCPVPKFLQCPSDIRPNVPDTPIPQTQANQWGNPFHNWRSNYQMSNGPGWMLNGCATSGPPDTP